MLSTLASLLLLGIFPSVSPPTHVVRLPGAQLLKVSAPAHIPSLAVTNLTASGVLLLDAASGQELYARNADTPLPMASTAKIMTALLLLENHSPTETVTVPTIAENIGGSVLRLKQGEHFLLKDLLKGLLLPSANDVAYTLALHRSVNIAAFITLMNERAQSLGLRHTHFASPDGHDVPGQQMSARDLAWLTERALSLPVFSTIVALPSARIASREGSTFTLTNTNELLHSQANVLGVKTGTTDDARECLVVLFTEGNRRYLLVLLGSQDRYADARIVMQALESTHTTTVLRQSRSSPRVTPSGSYPGQALAPGMNLHATTGAGPLQNDPIAAFHLSR